MSRSPSSFKQTDVTRALKAARAAGLEVYRFEIEKDGKIVIVSSRDEPKATALEKWRAARASAA